LCFCASTGARAGEWELGGSLGVAQEEKGGTNFSGNWPTVPYTTVQNSFTGAWNQAGLLVGYEALHKGAWGLWLQGQYSEAVSHPGFLHKGETVTGTTTTSETFRGDASYHAQTFGLAVTRRFSFGEVGLGLGLRTHALSADGTRESRNNTTFTYDHYTVSHSYRDTLLTLSFTALQDQGAFRSFQKVSIAGGFGSTAPAVNPGPSDWQMREAYLAQIRPNREFRITLGVRL